MNKVIFENEAQFVKWFVTNDIARRTRLTLDCQMKRFHRATKKGKRITIDEKAYAVMSRGKRDVWLVAIKD